MTSNGQPEKKVVLPLTPYHSPEPIMAHEKPAIEFVARCRGRNGGIRSWSRETFMRLLLPRHWLLAAIGVAAMSTVSLTLIGCGSRGDSTTAEAAASLGKPVDEDVPTVHMGELSEDRIGTSLAVEGEIVQQCPSTGCWFRIKDDAGEVFVDLAPAKLRLTDKRVGQQAKVTGRLVKQGGQLRLEARHVELEGADAGLKQK